jgi:hypothetical protein
MATPELIHGVEAVLRRSLALIEASSAPHGGHERQVQFTFQRDGDILDTAPALAEAWWRALRTALLGGTEIVHLWRPTRESAKTLKLVRDILALIGAGGTYLPLFFPGAEAAPSHDLLIVPGTGALELFSSGAGQHVDAAYFYSNEADVAALSAYFDLLRRRCTPVLKTYPPMSAAYDVALTEAEELFGDRYLVKGALSVNLEPPEMHADRAASLMTKASTRPELLSALLANRERRSRAFYAQLERGARVRDMCPRSAINRLGTEGLYGKDDWLVALGGAPVSAAHAAQHITAVVDVLERYPTYELALVDDDMAGAMFDAWWEVKVGQAVFLESWPLHGRGEVDLEIREPTAVDAFARYFDTLWTNLPEASKERRAVISFLRSQVP